MTAAHAAARRRSRRQEPPAPASSPRRTGPRVRHSGSRLAPAVLAGGLAATLLAAALLGAVPKPVSAGSVAPATSVQTPAVPGAGTAYLGAFIDPNGASLSATDPTGGTASVQAQLSALPNFDDQEGRSPSMLSTYQNWTEPVDVAGLDTVAATGAIPLVTWSCGDTDAHVAAGLDDQRVTAEARGLAATDVPVLLRWFPDPNRPSDPATASCLGATERAGLRRGVSAHPKPLRLGWCHQRGFRVVRRHIWHGGPGPGELLPGRKRRGLDRGRWRRPSGRPGATGRVHRRVRVLVRGVLECRQAADGVLDRSPDRIAIGLSRSDPVRSPEPVSTDQVVDLLRRAGSIDRRPVPT